jgi:hypothetical protein
MPYREDNTDCRQRQTTNLGNLGAANTARGQVVPATQLRPVDRSATAGVARPRPSVATGQRQRAEDVAQQPSAQDQTSLAARLAELQQLCQQLQATHRCPGRCVFTGELRQTGWRRASGVEMFGRGLSE